MTLLYEELPGAEIIIIIWTRVLTVKSAWLGKIEKKERAGAAGQTIDGSSGKWFLSFATARI